jgi:hypothetical protein
MKHSVELIPTIFTTYNFHILRICFDLHFGVCVCVGGGGGGVGGGTKTLPLAAGPGECDLHIPRHYRSSDGGGETQRDAAYLQDPTSSLAITNSVQ